MRWRPLAWVTAALMAAGLSVGFASAASAVPGPATGVAPGATTVGATRYLFFTAGDGSVWQKVVGGGAATPVGGVLISASSPVSDGSHIVVFGEGTDHRLWSTTCTPGGTCGPWSLLGGWLTSKPGAVFVDGVGVSVYVRGTDGAVWGRDQSVITGAWDAWHLVGGALLSGTGPAAASNGTQHLLVVGTDYHLWMLAVGAPSFSPVGGTTTASPGLALDSVSDLVGYATGTDRTGWSQDLTTHDGWSSLGRSRSLTSGFGATSDLGTPYGYAVSGSGQVYENAARGVGAWSQVTS